MISKRNIFLRVPKRQTLGCLNSGAGDIILFANDKEKLQLSLKILKVTIKSKNS